MPEPFLWNAVIIGAWNPAILSPDGVRRRLFQLPDRTPIELEMAVDRPGLFRVIHEGVIVIPMSGRLEIQTQNPNNESLQRACELCSRALQGLPETPVSAAGVNIRYRFPEFPDAVFDLMRARLDGTLSDAGYQIAGAVTKRSVTLAPGVVNVQITQATVGGSLEFNFHRDSTVSADLVNWLGRVQEFVTLSDQMVTVLGVDDVRREIHA